MNTKASVEAFAPASMGNVGVGFDILGLAFKEPGDIVRVTPHEDQGAIMLSIDGDGGALPLDADKNTASVAVNAYLQQIEAPHGVRIELHKHLPLASGLGSSAASAVAAVVATNALFNEPLSRTELLAACLEGEALVSGYHADNVAPSLLGGFVLVNGITAETIQALPVPADLHLALVTPHVEVPTKEARAVLPESVSLKTMVAQTGMLAAMIDAVHRGDVQAMGVAMEGDCVIEPARTHLIPRLKQVRSAAKSAGAAGVVISGAGPTLCAVCNEERKAQAVANAMSQVYFGAEIGVVSRYTQVDLQGARVIRIED